MAPGIIVNSKARQRAIAAKVAIDKNYVPLQIRCPECKRIYTVYVKDFDQGLHVLLGQMCPNCKRAIRESDDPDNLIMHAKATREAIQNERGQNEDLKG